MSHNLRVILKTHQAIDLLDPIAVDLPFAVTA